jgi:hypothetical protein
MALFFLLGVLRGFPAVAYRRTPHRKPLCGLDQNKNCSFLNWTHCVHFGFMDGHQLKFQLRGKKIKKW